MDRFEVLLDELIPAGVLLRLLANLSLSGLTIAVISLLLALMMGRTSAATRHLVLSLAFVGMAVVPILSLLFPASPDLETVETNADAVPITANLPDHRARRAPSARADQPPQLTHFEQRTDQQERSYETSRLGQSTVLQPPMNASVTGHHESDAAARVPPGWFAGVTLRDAELMVTVVWCLGVVLLCLRVLGGQVSLWGLRRSSRELSDSYVSGIAKDALKAVGLQRSVAFLETDRCSVPLTCGWLQPAVVLPTVAREWSAGRLRMVLLHELAHVRRRDCLWQWLVFVVTACHWFNPLVWLAAARLREEQEHACDDAVLTSGVRASDYAEALLDISTGGRRNLFALCSAIAMARSHRLSSRIQAILDERRFRQRVSPRICVVASLAAILLVASLGQFAQASFQVDSESAGRTDGPSPLATPAFRDVDALEVVDADDGQPSSNSAEQILITLPGGHLLGATPAHDALVESSLALLNSTRIEGRYLGRHDTSLAILFSPPREIPFSFAGLEPSKPETVRISRLSIDVRKAFGPDDVVAEIDGVYRSFSRPQLEEWVAFRRELDRLMFGRPRPIIPAIGEWSKPLNGLQARLGVDNWRDPMIGVFLELKNIADLANTLTIPLDASDIHFELRDHTGENIPDAGLPRSGPVAELRDFRLPFDSSLRFNLAVSSVAVTPGDNAMIALRSHAWRIPSGDFNAYQLSASFTVERDRGVNQTVWHGELHVPPVNIQAARRERTPDRIISRSYNVDAGKRLATLEALATIFHLEEDVSFQAGGKPTQIEATAAESRQGFIRDIVHAVDSGDTNELLPPEVRIRRSTITEIAHGLAAILPDWALHAFDSEPRALADGHHGLRIVLRRTWKEYTDPPQRAELATETSGPFVERHEDWEFVLVPVQPAKAPANFKSQINWQASTSPYHPRDMCLGEGHGYVWFTHGTIPLQHFVREEFELKGGDDPIQLAADGLLVDDTGTNTANSVSYLLAQYGDRALPYIEKAIQQAQQEGVDPWKAIVSLSQIQTPRATDMLIRLFESGETRLRRPAGYALIHKPYRRSAKQAYLAMLEDHVSVERAAEACVEFEWTEAIPILQALVESPNNIREFQYALHARRTLEGRPIAEELLAAEETLRKSTRPEVDPQLEQQIASAREVLIRSEDAEAANLAALSLAVFVNKADVSRVRKIGIEILKLRPRQETLRFLQLLANGIQEDERGRIESVVHAINQ